MHGHHDSDHYDVQFTTRQLVMLFGLLIVVFLIAEPRGLYGIWSRVKDWRPRTRRSRE